LALDRILSAIRSDVGCGM